MQNTLTFLPDKALGDSAVYDGLIWLSEKWKQLLSPHWISFFTNNLNCVIETSASQVEGSVTVYKGGMLNQACYETRL